MSENRRSGNATGNTSKDVYEVHPRKDGHGFYLISERLPFGRLWYREAADAVDDAKCYSRSHGAIIRVFNESGAVIETHEYASDFKEW
jgi:hypothetical protein